MDSYKIQSPLLFLLLALLIGFLGGCGGGGQSPIGSTPPLTSGPGPMPTPPVPAPLPPGASGSAFDTRASTARFLTQATFGPRPADLDALTGRSASAWFEAELAKPTTLIIPEFARYEAMADLTSADPLNEFTGEATTMAFWTHAVAADDQLRQRVAFALSQILVVSNAGGETLSDVPHAVAWYQDILRRNAFGNYRTLLEEVTYSPAMGFYLTYIDSKKADPLTGRMPDENYAREILQLFSIGLIELQADGSARLDVNGQPIETYNNVDVTGLARVFTGLELDFTERPGGPDIIFPEWQRPMRIEATNHSDTVKQFLGTTIPASTDARTSITQALNVIFAHPNVGPFIGRQLIQRLTTSSPSPGYILRVASAFDSGTYLLPDGSAVGTSQRGDLAATIAAVLFDTEARQSPTSASDAFGKVREPILRFTAWARAFNVGTVTPEFTTELWNTQDTLALSQHPYRAPSVFNFYRPGYIAPGSESGQRGLTAPELQIVNASSTPGYANFIGYFVRAGTRTADVEELREIFDGAGVNLDPNLARQSFVPDYSAELSLAASSTALVDLVADKLTYDTLRPESREQIASTLDLMRSEADFTSEELVHNAVLLVMLSPDFLVQR
ncbi:MAG: DUF1800 family protein [Pseudomonadota bacterium]